MHGVKELIIPEKNTFSPTFSPTGCCELLSCLGNYGTLFCSRVIFLLLLAIIRLIHLQQKICSVVSQEKTAILGITSEKKKKKKIKTISCRCVCCFCWQLIKNSSLKQYVPNWQMWTVLNVEKCFPHGSDFKHDCFWQQIFSDRFSNDLMCVGVSAAAKAKDPYLYTSLKRNKFLYKHHRATVEGFKWTRHM